MNPKLYLCTSLLVTKADADSVSRIHSVLKQDSDILEFLKLIAVLWPEMDDPMKLSFLIKGSETNNEKDESLILVRLIQEDPSLTDVTDMDADVLAARVDAVSKYIQDSLDEYHITFRESHMVEDFLRARTLIVNTVNENALYTRQLLAQSSLESLHKWVKGVLEPLDHLNRRLDRKVSIFEFESFTLQKSVKLMWNLPSQENSVIRSMMNYELKPFLGYHNTFEPFFTVIYNTENFPLNTLENFQVFKFISSECIGEETIFKKTKWNILYNNGINLSSIPLPNLVHEFQTLIKSFGDDSQVFEGLSLEQWLINVEFMNAMEVKDLKSLKDIQKEDFVVQTSYFSTIAQNICRGYTDMNLVQSVVKFIGSSVIFDKLSDELQTSILLENLLELGKFDILEQLVSSSGIKIDDSVIVQHFWKFFNSASNGALSNVDMKNANRTLNLLTDKQSHSNLYGLLAIVDRLSHYSLSFKRGVPFKPAHLIEYKDNPMEVIEKLLDLNPKLRKNIDDTSAIMKDIYEALEISPSDKNYSKEYSKLLSEHINNSLANGEFRFAFDQAVNLVDRSDASDHWITIFQVGKYIDPNWLDGEIPTEIIYLQLGILSKLLHVCPEKEYEVVATQWSGLELELSTRNLITDKYSIANSQRSNDNFMNEVSTNVGNFISGKFQWNLGSG